MNFFEENFDCEYEINANERGVENEGTKGTDGTENKVFEPVYYVVPTQLEAEQEPFVPLSLGQIKVLSDYTSQIIELRNEIEQLKGELYNKEVENGNLRWENENFKLQVYNNEEQYNKTLKKLVEEIHLLSCPKIKVNTSSLKNISSIK